MIAPTDGYVTQVFLRPGMLTNSSTPTMVFIHSETTFSASFPQSTLQRIGPGNEVEIVFDGIPGRVFRGKVRVVRDVIAQGQVQPSGTLSSPEDRSEIRGRIVAVIDIVDDLTRYRLLPGATAQVAIYTEHWPAVAIVRRIILRMQAWLNYVI